MQEESSGTRSCGLLFSGWSVWPLQAGFLTCAATPDEEDLARRIDQAVFRQQALLESYSDLEHYTLRNSRLKDTAEMVVRTEYHQDKGKTFHVISETGPAILRIRVFKSLLVDEQDRSNGEMKRESSVTSANYRMRLAGRTTFENRPCYILELIPKRKTKYLLSGRAWVLADDYSLVRIEGKTAASVSFWTGKPFIVREYQKIDGFWVAKKTQATTSDWLTGRSDLMIEHSQYAIVARAQDGR